jgi:hypothetical protein
MGSFLRGARLGVLGGILGALIAYGAISLVHRLHRPAKVKQTASVAPPVEKDVGLFGQLVGKGRAAAKAVPAEEAKIIEGKEKPPRLVGCFGRSGFLTLCFDDGSHKLVQATPYLQGWYKSKVDNVIFMPEMDETGHAKVVDSSAVEKEKGELAGQNVQSLQVVRDQNGGIRLRPSIRR